MLPPHSLQLPVAEEHKVAACGTAFCYRKCYRGGPTGDVAFTLDLHANEKNLCKILVALVRAELWDVFQHCSPLVMQENHITFTFLLHIQHPGKVVSVTASCWSQSV